jgi:hypoxanthine-DNA glycosylase
MPSESFPPIAAEGARVLILGSLPGTRSLAEQQYYAQPQNAFWKIMGELFGAGPDLPYATRTERLSASGIALWDVIASAERPGSLDSSIVNTSVVVNDFAALFLRCPDIGVVFFNGAKAAELFERRVRPSLGDKLNNLRFERLPSTSPAHAAMLYEDKLLRWQAVKREIEA